MGNMAEAVACAVFPIPHRAARASKKSSSGSSARASSDELFLHDATADARAAARSDLADRRDLDQELLAPGGVELHVRDALGALAGHLFDTALAEVVVVDAVARGELHIAVVTHLAR